LEERFMLPIPVVLGALWEVASSVRGRARTASAEGKTIKVIRCEACKRRFAYELNRTGHGGDYDDFVAAQRAQQDLKRLLATGMDLIPCPACGAYQSNMIPELRKQHRRWMIFVGKCLTVLLIPVGFIGLLINEHLEIQGNRHVPWSIFVGALVCLFAAGIGMFIWRYKLAQSFDPNDEDVKASRLRGHTRAVLLDLGLGVDGKSGVWKTEVPPWEK
jgi:hypothetical protein